MGGSGGYSLLFLGLDEPGAALVAVVGIVVAPDMVPVPGPATPGRRNRWEVADSEFTRVGPSERSIMVGTFRQEAMVIALAAPEAAPLRRRWAHRVQRKSPWGSMIRMGGLYREGVPASPAGCQWGRRRLGS